MAKKKHANNPQKLDPDLELLTHKYARIYIDNPDGLATKVYIEPAADMTDLSIVTVAKRAD